MQDKKPLWSYHQAQLAAVPGKTVMEGSEPAAASFDAARARPTMKPFLKRRDILRDQDKVAAGENG